MNSGNTEHVITWEFVARPGSETDFEIAYGPAGAWAKLFASSLDFLGTELLRSATRPRRYMTVDRWTSAESFRRFRETHNAEYEALDVKCGQLTESELALDEWTLSRPQPASASV